MKAFLLGIIQGLTEFLPVSSSGHLVILKNLLDFRMNGVQMEVTVHFATLLSIIVFFRNKILDYLTKEKLLLIIVGTLPIAIAGFLIKNRIELLFNNYHLVTIMLAITGIILFTTRKKREGKRLLDIKVSFLIGVAQAFALIPGLSRSGLTVTAALLLGLSREKSFEFSFILAIPALLGAFLLNIPEICSVKGNYGTLLTGGITAFISGLFALWAFYRIIKNKDLHLFSYYLWLVSAASLLLPLIF